MRELFDKLQVEGEAGITRLIEERTQETVTLDFKKKSDASKGRFEKDDKANLGKLLSGFANSSGGLAIWGVDARKGEDGVDCAQSPPDPIADIERFQSEAQTLAGQLIIPRHDGILIAHVPSSVSGAGYLLVLVERSDRRPHRCEAAGERYYFKRAGDSTFAMEHYDIEDAFSRVGVPTIEIECVPSYGGLFRDSGSIMHVINFDLYLKNTGAATAKYPYLQATHMTGTSTYPFDADGVEKVGLTAAGEVDGWRCFSGGINQVIHPGQKMPAVRMRTEYRGNGRDQFSVGGPFGQPLWLYFKVRAGCENARQV